MRAILPPANATIIHCLYVVQKARCFHCYQPMRPCPAGHTQGWQENGWTREHVVPKAKGGKDHKNIVLAHAYCNLMRGVRRFDAAQLAEALRIIDAAYALLGQYPRVEVPPPWAAQKAAAQARRAARRPSESRSAMPEDCALHNAGVALARRREKEVARQSKKEAKP